MAQLDLTIPQGTSWTQQLYYKTRASGATTSTPVSFINASAKMQLRSSYSDSAVVLELSTANARITLGSSNGSILLALTPALTTSLPAGRYVYDLELTLSGGTVVRLIEGTITCTPEVTK